MRKRSVSVGEVKESAAKQSNELICQCECVTAIHLHRMRTQGVKYSNVHTHMYVCMLYVCMYVCIYVCMYAHVYVYTARREQKQRYIGFLNRAASGWRVHCGVEVT